MITLVRLSALAALVAVCATPASAQDRPATESRAGQTPAPEEEMRPIRLQEAIRLAQQNAPSAIQARGQVRVANSGVRSAYGAFLPNLNANLGVTRSQGQRQGERGGLIDYSAPTSYSNGLQSSITLFDGGRSFADLRRARADVNTAEANELAQQFDIALQVKQQYYAILAARELEAAAVAQLEAAETQLRTASARLAAGVTIRSDSLRSVIQVGNASLQVLTAQNQVRVASAALSRLIASPDMVTAHPADTADLTAALPDAAALRELAAQGPAVRQAEEQLRSAQAAVRAAKSPYLPVLGATVTRNGSGFDRKYGIGSGQLAYSNTVSFGLSLPVFNRFQREDGVVRAQIAEANAEAQLRDARFLARQNLAQQLGALRTAEQRIRIQQATVAAAEEDLSGQQERYRLGASTLLDLLNSQTALSNARAALIQARQDYRVALAQVEAIVGRDLR